MNVLLAFLFITSLTRTLATKLLRRELDGYPLAKCNDGTTAGYFYDQDVLSAGQKVLVYLPDGGHCESAEDCKERCSDTHPESCTAAENNVMDLSDGIWSSSQDDNPFSDYFKVYIHYCTNDDYSGTRSASRLTGNYYFHGKHVLEAVLQDLVATFGIDRAERFVLAGSGAGARGVGFNCDYVGEAMAAVKPEVDVRCLLDSPDLVPWWVQTEDCQGRDLNKMELQHLVWGRQVDQSCLRDNKDSLNSTQLYHRCGLFSRYWEDIQTPFFLISSQYDPQYFESQPCRPERSDPSYPSYQLSWRRGTVALLQSMMARRPGLSVFSPNCESHSLLTGLLAAPYWSGLAVPLLDSEVETGLSSLLASWRDGGEGGEPGQAVDSLLRNNTHCVSAAPHTACSGRLARCRQSALLPSLVPGRGLGRWVSRRLQPPSSLWPQSYSQHSRCGLDPYYSACGGRARTVAVSGHNTFLSTSGDRVVPESAIPAGGRKGRLWRRFYYLQYLKLLYNKLKAEYAREYYRTKHQSNYGKLFPLKGVRLHAVATDLQYDDDYYYDYDYDDYSGATSGLFARIVKAVKKNKEKSRKNGIHDPSQLLLDSVQDDFEFPQELLDALPDLEDVDYEDFETFNRQVESLDKFSIRQKSKN